MMSRDLERFVILPLVNCQKRGEVVSPHSTNLANQMIIIVNLDPAEKEPKCALKNGRKLLCRDYPSVMRSCPVSKVTRIIRLK